MPSGSFLRIISCGLKRLFATSLAFCAAADATRAPSPGLPSLGYALFSAAAPMALRFDQTRPHVAKRRFFSLSLSYDFLRGGPSRMEP